MVFLATAPALADNQNPGFDVGLLLGYSLPVGGLGGPSGTKLNDITSGAIPAIVDVGFRVVPRLTIAVDVQYAIVTQKTPAHPGETVACNLGKCYLDDVQAGVAARFHVLPGGAFDPWVSLGLGWEWLHQTGTTSEDPRTYSETLAGPLAVAQVGADLAPGRVLGIGPVLGAGVGQFSSHGASPPLAGADASRSPAALHGWLTIGVRGYFFLR